MDLPRRRCAAHTTGGRHESRTSHSTYRRVELHERGHVAAHKLVEVGRVEDLHGVLRRGEGGRQRQQRTRAGAWQSNRELLSAAGRRGIGRHGGGSSAAGGPTSASTRGPLLTSASAAPASTARATARSGKVRMAATWRRGRTFTRDPAPWTCAFTHPNLAGSAVCTARFEPPVRSHTPPALSAAPSAAGPCGPLAPVGTGPRGASPRSPTHTPPCALPHVVFVWGTVSWARPSHLCPPALPCAPVCRDGCGAGCAAMAVAYPVDLTNYLNVSSCFACRRGFVGRPAVRRGPPAPCPPVFARWPSAL